MQRSPTEYDDSVDAYLPPDRMERLALIVLALLFGGSLGGFVSWLIR